MPYGVKSINLRRCTQEAPKYSQRYTVSYLSALYRAFNEQTLWAKRTEIMRNACNSLSQIYILSRLILLPQYLRYSCYYPYLFCKVSLLTFIIALQAIIIDNNNFRWCVDYKWYGVYVSCRVSISLFAKFHDVSLCEIFWASVSSQQQFSCYEIL